MPEPDSPVGIKSAPPPTGAAIPDSARYLGLLPRWAIVAVAAAAIVVGAVSLYPAWAQAREVGQSLQERVTALAAPRPGETPDRIEIRDANVAILATISNHQSLALLAIASGFFLFGIGFALFLLGIEGRLRAEAAGGGANGMLGASGSAPGIAALAAGTVLVAIGATRNYDIAPRVSPTPIVFTTPATQESEKPPIAPAMATYPDR